MLEKLKRKMIKKFFRHMEEYDISMEELKKKQSEGAIIVDVRSSQEFSESHIEGAINIPEYEINSNIDKILEDKEEEIVLYCASGIRSKKAYQKLTKLDYTLYGGLYNW